MRVHRKACATTSESLGKPPFRSRMRPVGGHRKVLTMHRIACNFPPTRRAAYAISMSHDQRPLVLRTREVNNVISTADGTCAGNPVYLGLKPGITESAFEVPDSSG